MFNELHSEKVTNIKVYARFRPPNKIEEEYILSNQGKEEMEFINSQTVCLYKDTFQYDMIFTKFSK